MANLNSFKLSLESENSSTHSWLYYKRNGELRSALIERAAAGADTHTAAINLL